MGTPPGQLSRSIGPGLLVGALYGTFQFIGGESLLGSFLSGLLFAAVMAAGFYFRARRLSHLSGLSYRQQLVVTRAVRQGRPVSDSALEEATIRQARLVQELARSHQWAIVLVWCFVSVSALALVAALALGDAVVALAGAFSLVVWVVILIVGPAWDRRRAANARAAETAVRGAAS